MVKRKVGELEKGIPAEEPRRSSRRKPAQDEAPVKEEKPATTKRGKKAKPLPSPEGGDVKSPITNGSSPRPSEKNEEDEEDEVKQTKPSKSKAKPKPAISPPEAPTGRQYWLMKAEPESRLEKGRDIKFSIDDLAAKTEPEPWDGIRAYPARNNLRAMKKGDLAFFYHSSCKVPCIVGIMEIVAEHTPDLSAHDPSAPYHDPSSTPENPKWSVVHVEFRQKLQTPITLKELREWFVGDGPLREMQMLKLGRLSVSKVSEGEWAFLVDKMKERGDIINF